MCGRFACILEGCHLEKACAYQNKAGNLIIPKYSYIPGLLGFTPNYNMAPTNTTPVLVSAKYEKDYKDVEKCSEGEVERVLCDMRWGIIPTWNDSTNITNAKAETILEKETFKKLFTSGQRCVVAVNGFYEWQAAGTKFKQPYFVYTPSDIEWQDVDYDNYDKYWSSSQGWTGPKLLNMAGIFSHTNTINPMALPYSFAVLTIESQEQFSSIHHRVPVILESEEAIDTWLNTESPLEKVKPLLKPPSNLEWYTVADTVGNVKNKDRSCLVKVEPKKTPQKKTPQKKTPQKKTPQKKTPQKRTPQKRTPQKALLPGQTSIKSFFKTSSSKNTEIDASNHSKTKRTKLDF